jgi:putative oxidoreductase
MTSKIQLGARIIIGLIYFVFGSMGLEMVLGFMQMPQPQMPEAASGFMKGMMGTGYFFPVLKITETVGGFFVLIGIAAPVALVVLAPITLQIILFHANLTPGIGELILPLLMVIAHVVAISGYWDLYKPLFLKRKVRSR